MSYRVLHILGDEDQHETIAGVIGKLADAESGFFIPEGNPGKIDTMEGDTVSHHILVTEDEDLAHIFDGNLIKKLGDLDCMVFIYSDADETYDGEKKAVKRVHDVL